MRRIGLPAAACLRRHACINSSLIQTTGGTGQSSPVLAAAARHSPCHHSRPAPPQPLPQCPPPPSPASGMSEAFCQSPEAAECVPGCHPRPVDSCKVPLPWPLGLNTQAAGGSPASASPPAPAQHPVYIQHSSTWTPAGSAHRCSAWNKLGPESSACHHQLLSDDALSPYECEAPCD